MIINKIIHENQSRPRYRSAAERVRFFYTSHAAPVRISHRASRTLVWIDRGAESPAGGGRGAATRAPGSTCASRTETVSASPVPTPAGRTSTRQRFISRTRTLGRVFFLFVFLRRLSRRVSATRRHGSPRSCSGESNLWSYIVRRARKVLTDPPRRSGLYADTEIETGFETYTFPRARFFENASWTTRVRVFEFDRRVRFVLNAFIVLPHGLAHNVYRRVRHRPTRVYRTTRAFKSRKSTLWRRRLKVYKRYLVYKDLEYWFMFWRLRVAKPSTVFEIYFDVCFFLNF